MLRAVPLTALIGRLNARIFRSHFSPFNRHVRGAHQRSASVAEGRMKWPASQIYPPMISAADMGGHPLARALSLN